MFPLRFQFKGQMSQTSLPYAVQVDELGIVESKIFSSSNSKSPNVAGGQLTTLRKLLHGSRQALRYSIAFFIKD